LVFSHQLLSQPTQHAQVHFGLVDPSARRSDLDGKWCALQVKVIIHATADQHSAHLPALHACGVQPVDEPEGLLAQLTDAIRAR
jgi:hypothetical protein